jgi:hypothetical protein
MEPANAPPISQIQGDHVTPEDLETMEKIDNIGEAVAVAFLKILNGTIRLATRLAYACRKKEDE